VFVCIQWRSELTEVVNAPAATMLALLCWLIFAAVAHILSTRRCLVR